MKTCVIFISHNLNDTTYQLQLKQLLAFSNNENLHLQTLFTDFAECFNFLNSDNTTDLLIIYSLKVFDESALNCLECLIKIMSIDNLNLYVYQNKMYAKNTDGTVKINFKTILEVLSIVSKLEQKKKIDFI